MANTSDLTRMRDLYDDLNISYSRQAITPKGDYPAAYMLVVFVDGIKVNSNLFNRETIYYFDADGQFLDMYIK